MASEETKTGLGGRALLTPIGWTPLLLSVLAFGSAPADPPDPPGAPPGQDLLLDHLEARAAVVEDGLTRAAAYHAERVEPVARILQPFHPDRAWVRRVSRALVRQGAVTGLDPRALASVLLVENPWLDPAVRSPVGAVGLMQVMPIHAGNWGCGSVDLTDPETNICHGARIFAAYLERHRDVDRALLAYNGCVKGTNTPDCHLYPSHVYSRAGRAAMQRWLGDD